MSSARPALRRLVVLGAVGAVAASGALLIGATPAVAATATRYVATSGNDGGESPNHCTVKAKPCKTIQHAVDEAASGDTVSVAAGTYAESVLVAGKSLSIRGASAASTVVTGGGVEHENGDIAFEFAGPSAATIDSLSNISAAHVHDGAGVAVTTATATLSHTIVRDNALGVVDESLDADSGALTISDSTVSDNTGISLGGATETEAGVISIASSTTIERTTVSGNTGVGIEFASELAPNEAASKATVRDSTISGNSVVGLAAFGTTLSVDNSTLNGNGGGGIYTELSDTTVTDSTVTGTTPYTGSDGPPVQTQAGISAVSSDATTNDSAQPANLNRRVAAVLPASGALHKDLVKAAAAPAAPPADAPTGSVTVSGTVVSNSALPDCVGDVTDNGYNLSSDAKNSCDFSAAKHDLIKTAPKLGALADNGGSTKTQLPATDSPVIDAIATGSAGCVKGATDQRGVSRPQGARCDIGAVEVAMASPLVITTSSLPHGTVGKAYHERLHAKGGTDSKYVWSLAPGSTLPGGLTLSPAGVLSGAPTHAGTSSVTVSVNDPVTKKFSLTIAAAPAAGRGPNGGGNEPIANTGAPIGSLSAVGIGTVLVGLLLMVAAGVIGKRQGRHRVTG